MSENPYEASLEYGADPSFARPSQSVAPRPKSVVVFGVLNLAFGALGILGSAASLLWMLRTGPNSFGTGQTQSPYYIFFVVTALIGFVTNVILIVGGVGLLRWKSYGRKASILYGWLTISTAIVSTGAQIIVSYQSAFQNANMGPNMVWGILVAIAFNLVMSMTYPILLLIFMYSRNVKLALSEAPSAQAGANVTHSKAGNTEPN